MNVAYHAAVVSHQCSRQRLDERRAEGEEARKALQSDMDLPGSIYTARVVLLDSNL